MKKPLLNLLLLGALFTSCSQVISPSEGERLEASLTGSRMIHLEEKRVWDSFQDIQDEINDLWDQNFTAIADQVRIIRPITSQGMSDEELFILENCGPSSIVFQNLLIENGIWAELRTNEGPFKYHEYLLYRAPMSDGRVLPVIIDPTYRQWYRGYASQYLGVSNGDAEEINDWLLSPGVKSILSEPLMILQDRSELVSYLDGKFAELNQTYPLPAFTPYYGNYSNYYELPSQPDPELMMLYTRYLSAEQHENLLYYAKAHYGGYTSQFSQLYFRGTANNWNASPMVPVADHTWETKVSFGGESNPRFKFDVNGDWGYNFGDNTGNGFLDQGGSDIPVDNNQSYKIRFNESNMSYSLIYIDANGHESLYKTLYIRGTFNNWGITEMTLDSDYSWKAVVTFPLQSNQRFKIDAFGDWSLNYGSNGSGSYLVQNGGDVSVTSGTKEIIFNEDTVRYFVFNR